MSSKVFEKEESLRATILGGDAGGSISPTSPTSSNNRNTCITSSPRPPLPQSPRLSSSTSTSNSNINNNINNNNNNNNNKIDNNINNTTTTNRSRKPHPTFLADLPTSPFHQYGHQNSLSCQHKKRPFRQSPLRASSTIVESYFPVKGSQQQTPTSSPTPSESSSSSPKKSASSPYGNPPTSVNISPSTRPYRQGSPLSPTLVVDQSSSSYFVIPSSTTSTSQPHSPVFSMFQDDGQTSFPAVSDGNGGVGKLSSSTMSSRTYHSHLAAQQLAFQNQQRELMLQATRTMGFSGKPMSPRLLPLGSPGPVTPLALEDGSTSYMFANHTSLQLPQHLEKLATRGVDNENKASSS